MRKKLISLRR